MNLTEGVPLLEACRMRSLTMLMVALALAFGAGVAAPAAAQTDPVLETPAPAAVTTIPPIVWTLIEFPGVGPIDELGRYTAQFLPDGQVSIRADCNWVAGVWTAGTDGTLDITITQTTLVGCPPDSLEQPFVVNMDEATFYALDSFLLTITGPQGTMAFAPAMPAMA
jgi:heat shock protein HslJ